MLTSGPWSLKPEENTLKRMSLKPWVLASESTVVAESCPYLGTEILNPNP
jgi:hypothetical protein